MTSRISRISVGRVYNLGNYEHVRYELTVEIPEGESAATAITGVEKIIAGLSPLKNACIKNPSEIERARKEVEEMRVMPAVDWERRYGHCKGTPSEIIERYEAQLNEDIAKAASAIARAKCARSMFDNLSGAAEWKDAKQNWSNDDYFDQD